MPRKATIQESAIDGITFDDRGDPTHYDVVTAEGIQRMPVGGVRVHAAAKPATIQAMTAGSVTIAAAEGPDAKGPRKFDVLVYTGGILGGALNRGAGPEDVIIDLAGMQAGKSIVANLDHDKKQRVGHVTDVKNDGKQVNLTGFASAATPARSEVIASAADGFVWQASIEASPTKIEVIKAGKSVTVNGQTFNGPTNVARTSVLKGFAFLSHGADDNTTVTIAAGAAHTKEQEMDPKFQAFIEGMLPGTDISTLSEKAIENLQADYDGKQGQRKKPATKHADVIEARKAENDRVAGITALVEVWTDKHPTQLDAIQAMADQAIEQKWDADKLDHELFKATEVPKAHTVFQARGDKKLTADVITAALCVQGGLKGAEDQFSDETLQTAHDKFKGGIGLKQLYRICARQAGYYHDGDDVTLDMHRAACGVTGGGMQIKGVFSTMSLPGILSNTANKFLLEGWGEGEKVWREIPSTRPVRDFRTTTAYKLSGNMKFVKVAPSGELQHGSLAEGSYTNKLDTHGRMFGINREDIINDDLAAMSSIPRELGYGANDGVNEAFWTEFLSADATFFDSGNNNVSTGVLTGTTGIATLTAAELVFRNQTKPNGTPLGIMPTMLLVPSGSYRAALQLMTGSTVTGSTGPLLTNNTFAGNYSVHTSAYLSNSAYTGYSTIKWYLLAKRPGFSVIEMVFLNGKDTPTIETADAPFHTLGVLFRGYFDFGVNLQEPRAGVQGTGA